MEDDNIFSSAQASNAPGLVHISTKIQPGMSGAMSLLYTVRDAMQFAHVNADPSLTILPIREVNTRPCPPITSPKPEKGFPEYWAAIAKYIFVKLKFFLNTKGFDEIDGNKESNSKSGGKKKKGGQVWGCLRVSANDDIESIIMDIRPDLMELDINISYKRVQLPDTYTHLGIVGLSNAFCDVGLNSKLMHHMKVAEEELI